MGFFDSLVGGIGEALGSFSDFSSNLFGSSSGGAGGGGSSGKSGGSSFLDWFDLSGPVGMEGTNDRRDVAKVEGLLGKTGHLDLSKTDGATGYFDARTDQATRQFQKDHGLKVDGLLNPGGSTISTMHDRFAPAAARPATGGTKPAPDYMSIEQNRPAKRLPSTLIGERPAARAKPSPLAPRPVAPKPLGVAIRPTPKPKPLGVAPKPARKPAWPDRPPLNLLEQPRPEVSAEAVASNRRTVEFLRTTTDDGDLPKFIAEGAQSGARGRAEVDNLFEQIHERDPKRAASLKAKVQKLAPDYRDEPRRRFDINKLAPPDKRPYDEILAETRRTGKVPKGAQTRTFEDLFSRDPQRRYEAQKYTYDNLELGRELREGKTGPLSTPADTENATETRESGTQMARVGPLDDSPRTDRRPADPSIFDAMRLQRIQRRSTSSIRTHISAHRRSIRINSDKLLRATNDEQRSQLRRAISVHQREINKFINELRSRGVEDHD